MKPENLVFLEDIRNAIAELDRFVTLEEYDEFLQNRPSQLIAERLLIVIGESAARIRRKHPDLLKNSDKIIGMRNRVVHDYSTIDKATVYTIIIDHIPKLKNEVEELLRQHG
jgi:uncharacterized protein with HEPN domain